CATARPSSSGTSTDVYAESLATRGQEIYAIVLNWFPVRMIEYPRVSRSTHLERSDEPTKYSTRSVARADASHGEETPPEIAGFVLQSVQVRRIPDSLSTCATTFLVALTAPSEICALL